MNASPCTTKQALIHGHSERSEESRARVGVEVSARIAGHTSNRMSAFNAGFTFLELMVVMAMLAIITAAVVPVYSAAMAGLQSRNYKNDLIAVIHFTQQKAIVASREYRIYFDDDEGQYFVMAWARMDDEEKIFEPVPEAWGEKKTLPRNLSFKKVPKQKDKKLHLPYLAFYPNGACDRAEIRVEDARGSKGNFSIETLGVLGKLKVGDSSSGNSHIII